MNWKEIKDKHPKALQACLNWFSPSAIKMYDLQITTSHGSIVYDDGGNCGLIGIRDLYDFFDEQDIYIEISYLAIIDPMPIGSNEGWWYTINHRSYETSKDTRPETEEAAFLKAFEILEEKLRSEER